MLGILADLRHAFRVYRRTPIASGLAVVVLAVALAFVTAFVSMYVDSVLRPHPGFEQGGRLVTLEQTDGRVIIGVFAGLIDRASDEVTAVESMAGLSSITVPVADGEPLPIEIVTEQYFPGLRPRLHSGRGFEPADHDTEAAGVAVVSYRYWRDVLGGASVPGALIELDLQPRTLTGTANIGGGDESEAGDNRFEVIGVMAPEMRGTTSTETAVWLPYERVARRLYPGRELSQITLSTIGRRSDGASSESVAREISARYADDPDSRLIPGFRIEAADGVVAGVAAHRETVRQLNLFLMASVLIAVVAAANVSLFLLARAPGRRRELGIRMAVGAPLRRLAGQLATEAGLLVVTAAVLGVLVSAWLGNVLRGLAFLRRASWRDVSVFDWRVLMLIGIFLLLLTLLVSLAPMLGLKRLGIAASSRQVAARAGLAQRLAGAFQIAVAGTVAAAAIAFFWHSALMTLGDPGYEVRDRHVVQLTAVAGRSAVPNERAVVVEAARLGAAIETIPGVAAVAFGSPVPGFAERMWMQVPDPQDPAAQIQLRFGRADSRYVDVLGLRLLHGRTLTAGETGSVLVNRAFAQRFFGRDDVIGERAPIATGGGRSGPEIVGVIEDLSFEHPAADVEPILFQASGDTSFAVAVVESSLSTAALQQELERIAGSGELEVRVATVQSLRQLRDSLIAPDRARSWLTIAAAVLVVLLAAYGFYGTQRYVVAAGRREYAIRASIGAGPKALGRLVIARGLMLGIPGLVVGVLLAFITVAWLRDGFVSREISPFVVTLAVVGGLVLLLAAASLGPARQARRTRPAPLLREE